jgi:poly(A) polymerase
VTRTTEALGRLRRAEWLLRPETQRILALLDGAEGRTRAVGGAVRDTLLDVPREVADLDLATELLPHEVTLRAQRAGLSVYPTGIDHGTVTLKLDSVIAEVTTLREDIETDGRRAVVRFGRDWQRDAERRDFTLNALYAGMDGALFDPLGGLGDCLDSRVRFIGDANQRIAEDRLRVFRFFRFSASHAGEKFDAEGLAACGAAADRLGNLAAERIGAEMRRMLALPRIGQTLKLMNETGIVRLDPEAVSLIHTHERRVRRPDYAARLALLCSRMDAEALQRMWRLSNDDMRSAGAILAVARLLADYRLHEAAYRYPAALAEGLEVAAVLANWGEAGKAALSEQLQRLDVPRFPVNGGDLMARGFRPGPALGRELDRLEQVWIEGGFALDRETLLEAARR